MTQGRHDIQPAAGAEYDSAVLREFRRVLFEYCAVASVQLRSRTAGLRLRITVATRHPVDGIRDELRGLARQTIESDLPGGILDEIVHVRDRNAGRAACRVLIAPALYGGAGVDTGAVTEPLPDPYLIEQSGPVAAVSRGAVVLTLAYGGRFRWTYPLIPAPDWIPLGRGLPAGGQVAGIRLPGHATPVPRGVLVMVRCWGGRTDLRRSLQRAEYVVTVDGTRLRPGTSVVARRAGSIDFGRAGRAGTTLRYRLSEED